MVRIFAGLAFCTAIGMPAHAQQVTSAPGAVFRALDKVSGHSRDIELRTGQTARLGRLALVLTDCRYPAGNPSGNAYAALEISETGKIGTLFSGWMIASAPAISALEHPRYDVWVMRCTTS